MGKHKKKKHEALSSGRQISDGDICSAVGDLWKLLQNNSSNNLRMLWDEYEFLLENSEVCKVDGFLMGNVVLKNFQVFEKWLQEHKAQYDKCDEKVLEIPEKLMLSSFTAMQGVLGTLIEKDDMLRSMPNISLAIHLLNETYSSSSFWKPYIDILPQSFSLPLYFTKEELLLLQGSPCLIKCLLQIRNIVKLYSHLHRVIRTEGDTGLPIFESGFLYDDFIWAVSCVMSRQNEIPSKPGHLSPTLALIPLWDLCNHKSGHISTFFNVESSTCDCYAQCKFKIDEEFTIFYGPRTNSELLLQQGFVYLPNQSDYYPMKLGLGTMEEEKTKSLRIKMLQITNLPMTGLFKLAISEDQPFSADMLAFVRIFTASLNTLEVWLQDKKAPDNLRNVCLTKEDTKPLEFLEKRCMLLLKSYPESISEDEEYLKTNIPLCATHAVHMRMCEKKILQTSVKFAKDKIEELETTSKQE